ncbi:microcin-processing peptidase 1 [Sulfurirhabdus autotrophica]|uniref:Microcin-processing peptidase 1 n=2 Tax=Sulfurirhabdus autotrophica TaxID=1706046 RepID=A0A4R3XU13_9PROT|nr:microcin-processing peptidase 1 [Sulfurirhabdus autotrophica]
MRPEVRNKPVHTLNADCLEVFVSDSSFSYSKETLQQITQDILDQALKQGASACEAEVSEGFGQSVTVRQDEVETIEYNRDKGIGVTVYIGKQRGHASTSDLNPQAIHDTVKAALSIAKFTASDEFSGLADEKFMAKNIPDLDLYHPWGQSVEASIEQAKVCEAAALSVDKRINNSEGATVGTQESHFIYGNSMGFMGGYAASRHSISCAVIAESEQGMQRDYWYTTSRNAAELDNARSVGLRAGEKTVRRLDARKLQTMQVPVLFDPSLASGLLSHFVSAVSGGSLYRKSSFLLDSLGQEIFSPFIELKELPHIKGALASAPFDNEGVATHARDVVSNGVLQGYFLGSYSARKLGMATTGNAGGNHNLILSSTGQDFAGLLKMMGKGLLVTELLGHGVNPVTGDYSRGAAGFWVENGEIQYPVEEITIAGNLKDMFKGILAVGNDVLIRGSKQCGSILVDRMTVAGE